VDASFASLGEEGAEAGDVWCQQPCWGKYKGGVRIEGSGV